MQVRVVNAVMDLASVSVAVNSNVAFGSISAGSVTPAGTGAFTSVDAGGTFTVSKVTGGTLATQAFSSLVAGGKYTIVVMGNGTAGANPGVTMVAIADTTPPVLPGAAMRIVNALDYLPSAGGDSVEFWTNGASGVPAPGSAPHLRYGATLAVPTCFSSCDFTFDVRAPGNGNSITTLYSGAVVGMSSGASYIVVLRNPSSGAIGGMIAVREH